MGETITIVLHAYAREGVAEVQLAVNGQPYRLAQAAQPGDKFVEIQVEWQPGAPGDHRLSITPFDMTGEAGHPAHVSVRVTGEVATPLLTPTEIAPTVPPGEAPPPPTGTPLPPTAAPPPPTGTPRPPTATPPAPTVTPVPPTPVPPTPVPPTVTPVPPTVTPVPPSPTPIPPSPTPLPDTEGPPAPGLVSPTGGVGVPCADVTLDWNAVSDPSGIGTYYVKVEKVTGSFKSGGWTTTVTERVIPIAWFECGQSYRWSVAAEDGADNMGAWSGWAQFTVTIT